MLGIVFILISTLCLAIQNVVFKLIVSEHSVLGLASWGGWVTPTADHAVLLLQMRLLLMVLLLLCVSPALYPATLMELREAVPLQRMLKAHSQWTYILQIAGTGAAMVVSLTLLYVSISLLPVGIAITIFFIHPAATLLIAWKLWGDRPSLMRFGSMGTILIGVALTAPRDSLAMPQHWLIGTGAGILAGAGYAAYNVMVQVCVQTNTPAAKPRLHPIPFSLVSFVAALILASLCVLVIDIEIATQHWPIVWGMSLICAIAAVIAYVLNSFGIRLIGAAYASLISASTPIFTTLLAALLLREQLSLLQWMGTVLVTLSVAALSIWTRRP